MHFVCLMAAVVLFMSFFRNGNVKGNNLDIQVLNNADLMKLNSMIQRLAQENDVIINLVKKIDSMEDTMEQKLADLENKLLALINAKEITFGTKVEEKVSTIEQKFAQSIGNSEKRTENIMIGRINATEETFTTKLEEKVNTIEQKFTESIKNAAKDIENRLIAMLNTTEVTFGSKLDIKVSTIEQKFKESIEISEQLTEIRLIARINSSEETLWTKLKEKVNTVEQTFKRSIANTEKRIENRLFAKINASELTCGTKMEDKVSTIEHKLNENIRSAEKRIGTKLEEKVSTIEQMLNQSVGNSEKLAENRLIATIKATEVTFRIKLQEQVNTIEEKFKGSISKLNQTLGNLHEHINQGHVEEQGNDVRLVGGISQKDGRVEINFLGKWGTVKGTSLWDDEDANVVCRMLGLGGPGHAIGGGAYGEGVGPIWLDYVHCKGNEKSLADCPVSRWGSKISRNKDDAGVICGQIPGLDVRLVGGRSQKDGRVEINFLGKWGTVKSKYSWINADANVVCRMLGLGGPGHAIGGNAYGEGVGPIWLDYVHCKGNETTLADCRVSRWGSETSRNKDDAGVICGQIPGIDVRLIGGRSQNDGRVEIYFLGKWGTVRGKSHWDDEDANVVCRMLGLGGLGHAIGGGAYGEGVGPIWLEYVYCKGNETSLADCRVSRWGSETSRNKDDAGVICGQIPGLDVRLVGGKSQNDGRVEIYFLGKWGTVRGKSHWDDKDANVVCRMLGLGGPGHAIGENAYGEGVGPVWLDSVHCKGNETSLADCPHSPWGTSESVRNKNDAGVICGQIPAGRQAG